MREDGNLCIDLFCGLGGWTEGFLAEGWQVVGFDIERHQYGDAKYPAQLVIQDVLTLHGSQFRYADCIVASPPCQEFSYMAMPWKRGKHIAAALVSAHVGDGLPFPEAYDGSRTIADLTRLFDACFRIQREASEAAGRRIPMVIENVKGAQPWVGKAKAHFGSYYLWGDVESVGRRIVSTRPAFGEGVVAARRSKNEGGSWFAINHNTGPGHNPVNDEVFADGRKVEGFNFHAYENGEPGGSFQSAAVAGMKTGHPERSYRNGHVSTAHLTNRTEHGTKVSGDWVGSYAEQKSAGTISPGRLHGKNSDSRKAASAEIAKIPLPLSRWVARTMDKGR